MRAAPIEAAKNMNRVKTSMGDGGWRLYSSKLVPDPFSNLHTLLTWRSRVTELGVWAWSPDHKGSLSYHIRHIIIYTKKVKGWAQWEIWSLFSGSDSSAPLLDFWNQNGGTKARLLKRKRLKKINQLQDCVFLGLGRCSIDAHREYKRVRQSKWNEGTPSDQTQSIGVSRHGEPRRFRKKI